MTHCCSCPRRREEMMFTINPFAALTDFFSPLVMQVYLVLMLLAVAGGTLFDVYHKGSAKFFAQRKEKSRAAATRPLSRGETFSLAVETIAEAAVSGEFCKWPRRASHLLMMYGFLLYVVTTVAMVFGYPGAAQHSGHPPRFVDHRRIDDTRRRLVVFLLPAGKRRL